MADASVHSPHQPSVTILQEQQVMEAERRALEAARQGSLPDEAQQQDARGPMQAYALCLSGGGIRSATFSLGVLQGLAKKGWLTKFDFLSTVSGGGFIGSWLTVWLRQHPSPTQSDWDALFLGSGPAESKPIKHLRKYSNYLSPLLGFTTDFLGMVATFLGNLIVNWAIIVPLLVSATLLPWLWLGLLGRVAPSLAGHPLGLNAVAILLVPAVLVTVWLAINVLGVVVSRVVSPGAREYWTGLGAWLLVLALGWLLVTGIVLWVVPYWLTVLADAATIEGLRQKSVDAFRKYADSDPFNREDTYVAALRWDLAARIAASSGPLVQTLAHPGSLGVVGLVLGGLTSLIGYRSNNGPAPGGAQPSTAFGALGRSILSACAALFLLLVFFATAWATTNLLSRWLDWCAGPCSTIPFNRSPLIVTTGTELLSVAGLAAALCVFSYIASWAIGVNSFSMHSFYQRRLRGAYIDGGGLGTDAPGDPPLSAAPRRPLHIINAALNMTSPSETHAEWQERKATSFTFSALHVGSPGTKYRDSKDYAGGLALSQAMAISGAAASPNMGYHTSLLVSCVMAFFNVRLGVWLPNPGVVTTRKQTFEPPTPARLYWQEFLGRSTSETPFVYLSDGGHFENLGLYEMVRRRCDGIVVVDAGCDPDYKFEDLENAVRKIRIDLGIRVEFSNGGPTPESSHRSQRHYETGVIRYSEQNPTTADGKLILIKPVLSGDEPFDVVMFAREHSHDGDRFPQQPTSNQFFTESQFESYRALGEHSVQVGFPDAGLWSVPDSSFQPAYVAPQAATMVPAGPAGPSEVRPRPEWWSGLLPISSLGIVPLATTAAAAVAITLILAPLLFVNVAQTNPPSAPFDPLTVIASTPAVIAVPDTQPIDRIMLPFFAEAVRCDPSTSQVQCAPLGYGDWKPISINADALDLSLPGATGVLAEIHQALEECGPPEEAIDVVGFASSNPLDLTPGRPSDRADEYSDESMAFNLALANRRAAAVAAKLGKWGLVHNWKANLTGPALTREYAAMRDAAIYNDRLEGLRGSVSSSGTNIIAAKLTRRVDLRFDSSRLGKCQPTDVLERAGLRGSTR